MITRRSPPSAERVPNVLGKSNAFNALTPIGRGRVILVRLAFLLIRLASFRIVQKLLHKVSLVADQQRLIDLTFIHFARWAIVRRRDWPNLGGKQPADWPEYAYMMFCSNFNGEWEQYIDAFSAVIPGGMDLIWGTNVRYPGAKQITPFLAYIRQNQFNTDYYYIAYPGAATTDIRGALDLVERMNAFSRTAMTLPPDEFRAAYERFLVAVAPDLSTTGPAPWADDPEEPVLPVLEPPVSDAAAIPQAARAETAVHA